jgi:hypothetical protein
MSMSAVALPPVDIKLHARWQFPSDHLPVGMEVDGIKIVSWNVLNTRAMNWIYQDQQGLKGSMLTQLDKGEAGKLLTEREEVVLKCLMESIRMNHVIALQECSANFIEALRSTLPVYWQVVNALHDQNAILFNRYYFPADGVDIRTGVFSERAEKSIMHVALKKDDGKIIRLFNAHLPGKPDSVAPEEFAHFVRKNVQEGEITIALGDMNFEHDRMERSFGGKFTVYSPYNTNIDPVTVKGKCIDHFIVHGSEDVKIHTAKQIMLSHLEETLKLIN